MGKSNAWLLSMLSIAAALTEVSLQAQITVHYINVGQAASALIEFKDGAVMIDAGGETTSETPSGKAYRQHLLAYLNQFFQDHPSFNKTIEGIIISHPHKDHTMFLMDVMQNFTVHALVDNGAQSGSGFSDLKKARAFATQHRIHYMAVGDASIHGKGIPVSLLPDSGPDAPRIVLLSGARGCDNANNDSIAVRVDAGKASFLFIGDSENEDKTCTPELTLLPDRFKNTDVLSADVFHVAHHGSFNGSTADFLKTVSPKVAVISAGDPRRAAPGSFHAFQFGHPREVAVDAIVANDGGTRDAKDVTIFAAAKSPKTVSMTKAVYCTCWDGDIKVAYTANGTSPEITTSGFLPPVPVKDRGKKQ